MNIIKKEWFLFAMVAAIGLAVLMPDIGKTGGWLQLGWLTSIGIALIFFLHGIGLSSQKIKQGLSNWRLHVLIQVTTFVIYPLIWVIAGQGMLALLPSALAIGFCYLFALPSTISSSVAMTSIGKGNVPGAIFNASLSSILGIILTPLLVGLFTDVQGAQMEMTATIVSVAKLLLLPMVIGQLCRPLLAALLERYKSITNKVDKWVILMIVLNAFSDSVAEHIWVGFSVYLLLSCVAICLVVLLAIAYFLQFSCKKLQFNHEDEVAAVFCGTKKTLAAGIPMAKVIFGANPNLGMILLPIMLYHPIQLFYCAMLANRYAARATTAATAVAAK
ncbi:MAG: bile acid:sodium symporter family protein [Pseudomonas sp.]|uniref:bile acid:sodium symporter family protein n=1 Tax=Pseudomonas sp. TaxID=306 RepID=UPI003981D3CF